MEPPTRRQVGFRVGSGVQGLLRADSYKGVGFADRM
jgi:hypothetical protein